MSTTQYHCGELGRRQAVADQDKLNGIDFLEVATQDQLKLRVVFIHKLPKTATSGTVPDDPTKELKKENIRIDGGVRVTGIRVDQIDSINGKSLTLTVSARGDFSTYTLRLVKSLTDDSVPDGFDPQLASIEFSFKVTCPSDFDCKVEDECPPKLVPEPDIDYLAKDYASFRRLMLDRLSVLMPNWRERNAADVQITLVELLAYVGDHLSYFQDAVATEAYLGTARKRVSLRRHARLLDYSVSEGCNARAWVALTVGAPGDGKLLPGPEEATASAGATFITRVPEFGAQITELPKEHANAVTYFESLHDVQLFVAHNEIPFYTWSDSGCCLPRGATRATLVNNGGLMLAAGDLLLLEETISPVTGLAADADSTHRHVIRIETIKLGPSVKDPLTGQLIAEITWRSEDALPFALCLSARLTDADGNPQLKSVAVARGNIVLADQGRTVSGEQLIPATVPPTGHYRPAVPRPNLTFAAPFKRDVVLMNPVTATIETVEPAATAFAFSAADALPALQLSDSDELWLARKDLLASDRFAAEFVVEMERDGVAYLRFGDDVLGRRPLPGTEFALTYRIGNGPAGNLGAESLRHIVVTSAILPKGSITGVRNPLPARGGEDAEAMEEVRQFAPQAFRKQERAVTEADWAEVAQRFPGVQKAAARFRWTGSWYTVFMTVDRVGGVTAARDERFKTALRAHLEKYRVAGYDLEITDPVYVPLDLLLLVCVKPGYFRSDVLTALRRVFGRQEHADGTRGFFHPDAFTFGQSLFLSRVYAAAMIVAGVASVEVKRFQRWGRGENNELANAAITAAPLEILRLDNDPNFPENGKIEFELHGGL